MFLRQCRFEIFQLETDLDALPDVAVLKGVGSIELKHDAGGVGDLFGRCVGCYGSARLIRMKFECRQTGRGEHERDDGG